MYFHWKNILIEDITTFSNQTLNDSEVIPKPVNSIWTEDILYGSHSTDTHLIMV